MNIHFSERLNEAQVEALWQLYQHEWWSAGRELEDVHRLASSPHNIIYAAIDTPTDSLAGFARVISDRIYKALILDVIVDQAWRDQGLGKMIMERILHDPRLAEVRHFELYCKPGMEPFYEKWGFTAALGDIRFMRRVKPTHD